MTKFDYLILPLCAPWAAINALAFFVLLINPSVRSIKLSFMFYAPFLGLLTVAYRVWG